MTDLDLDKLNKSLADKAIKEHAKDHLRQQIKWHIESKETTLKEIERVYNLAITNLREQLRNLH